MTSLCGLTDANKADLHARLAAWFGGSPETPVGRHLAPVIDRIKSEACTLAALEMARKAAIAEERAEGAEAELERLRSALTEVRRVFDLQCPPMPVEKYVDRGAWMAHSWWNTVLGGILRRFDCESDECNHDWLDRPESDARECLICGIEVAG